MHLLKRTTAGTCEAIWCSIRSSPKQRYNIAGPEYLSSQETETPQTLALPGKPVAHNYGVGGLYSALLWPVVAQYLGYLIFQVEFADFQKLFPQSLGSWVFEAGWRSPSNLSPCAPFLGWTKPQGTEAPLRALLKRPPKEPALRNSGLLQSQPAS